MVSSILFSMWHLLHWENRVRADPDRPGYYLFLFFLKNEAAKVKGPDPEH